MKSRIITALLLSIAFLASCDKKTDTVTVNIQVKAPTLSESDSIYITGNLSELGSWQADGRLMKHIGNGIWKTQLQLPKETIIEYKFTKGSWETEAAQSDGKPMENAVLTVAEDTLTTTLITHWRAGEALPIEGQITGDVAYHKQMTYEGILDRDVIVWLPPNYNNNPEQRYSVLYMQDGQNIVDPLTASYKVDWQIDETATRLVEEGQIEPIIVVGIYCTDKRTYEYTPGEGSDAYMAFVTEKLKPFIDQTYRTKTEREYTAVGGSSAGGLISMMLAWEYPEVFSKAICMSPAFKIKGDNITIDYVTPVKESYKKDLQLYIDNGGVGLEARLQPGVDAMIKVLKEKGFKEGVDLFYTVDQEAQHSEKYWAERMPNALLWLFGKEK
ncbi:alpha/beta hydrolase-fold protein [Algivirga pacifica]|uniref:Alpha/beta hydrolase-fold protein n=1 Tax=Algivirga pacifica TaxID=1162670 RepID=A0ABP9D749_9BACT